MSLALYRKYRPATFAELKGQEHVAEPLQQALRNGRINHAYLFSGPRGCGKTSSARILARSLNCEQGPTPDPCGVCDSCVALGPAGSGHIDVIEIDAASHGGVDDARDLRERAFFAPVAARFKIYIIDEAHMVTREGFNALLKLVEEPPPHLKFVFATTEPEKVIGTIRSRTHHYPFRLIPPGTLRELLEDILQKENVPYEPAAIPLVVRAGAGSARDSESILDQLLAGADAQGITYARAVSLLGYTDSSLLDEVVDAVAAHDGAAVFGAVDRVMEGGQDPRRFTADLLERFRDLVVLSNVPDAGATGLLEAPPDELERMREQASKLGLAELTRAADLLHSGLTEMRGATSPRLLLELICARVLLPGAYDDEASLLTRLERLERGVSAPSASATAPAEPVRGGGAEEARRALRESAAGRRHMSAPAEQVPAERGRPVPEPAQGTAPQGHYQSGGAQNGSSPGAEGSGVARGGGQAPSAGGQSGSAGPSAREGDAAAARGGAQSSQAGGAQSVSDGAQSASAGAQSATAGAQDPSGGGGRSVTAGAQDLSAGSQSASAGGQSAPAGGRSASAGGRSASAGGRSASAGGAQPPPAQGGDPTSIVQPNRPAREEHPQPVDNSADDWPTPVRVGQPRPVEPETSGRDDPQASATRNPSTTLSTTPSATSAQAPAQDWGQASPTQKRAQDWGQASTQERSQDRSQAAAQDRSQAPTQDRNQSAAQSQGAQYAEQSSAQQNQQGRQRNEAGQRSEPAQQAPEPSAQQQSAGGADVTAVRQRWAEILEAVKDRSKVAWIVLMDGVEVASIEGNLLTLAFSNDGKRKGFASGGKDAVLRDALKQMFGVEYRIDAVYGNGSSGQNARSAPPPPQPGGSAGASSSPPPREAPQRQTPSDDLPPPPPGPTDEADEVDPEGDADADKEAVVTGMALIERELGGKIIQEIDNT